MTAEQSKPDTGRRAARRAEAERNDKALLAAARDVIATDGAHASVAAIAARAGVGVGSLYRRYRTKDELFQKLCELALAAYLTAAEEGLAMADPWDGLVHYLRAATEHGTGSLAPIAGTIDVTPAMADKNERGEEAVRRLIDRAQAAGVLRPDITVVDIDLLTEQLSKSPLLEHLAAQGRTDLTEAALNARSRLHAIVFDGLRAGAAPLPGHPPSSALFTERWSPTG
ncbi:TetR family transcriptional regulator [Prauserella marina]|uniref:DNA-binding transcriptional regulator, AcrR family n=1 Tax=Prauserella marina TaxID=530584 RepID=A0A222W0G6_9PSEU|nr:TetR family transcriptional regulator [Prauserella marina]ASR39645.1 TetR family transcriptional regulator [Prauserella marina]PWV75684.1 TetR family transcriptional regulator [Prauserella marina]SDD28825.1 DNA-binding transcriptional regulator, AcrR family [Prauserella marina]